MSVAIEICNSALIKLGAEPIQSFNDNTKEAKLCNAQYIKIRNAVLRSAPWSFAMRRAQLTPTTDTLEFGEGNVFQLPSDCIRVVRLGKTTLKYPESSYDSKYTIEGRKMISDVDTANIHYITDDVSDAEYDYNFREAVATALAADLAYAITQSNSLKAGLEAASKFWTDEARSHNSQEVSPEDFAFDDFLNARLGDGNALYD